MAREGFYSPVSTLAFKDLITTAAKFSCCRNEPLEILFPQAAVQDVQFVSSSELGISYKTKPNPAFGRMGQETFSNQPVCCLQMLLTSAAERCEPLATSQKGLAAASSPSRNWSALVSVSPHTSFPTRLEEGSGGARTPWIFAASLLTLARSASR